MRGIDINVHLPPGAEEFTLPSIKRAFLAEKPDDDKEIRMITE